MACPSAFWPFIVVVVVVAAFGRVLCERGRRASGLSCTCTYAEWLVVVVILFGRSSRALFNRLSTSSRGL